jgi:predicted transcriptional regulator of viral defense system
LVKKKISATKAFSGKLAEINQPVITDYELGVQLHWLYSKQKYRGQALRVKKKTAEQVDLQRIINALYKNEILSAFKKFKSVHRIFGKKIESEEEVVCSINPFAYISHLSAMEYHGLTDKIPRVLIYTAPEAKAWKEFAFKKMEKDYKGTVNKELPILTSTIMNKVGKKKLIKYNSVHTGAYVNTKNSPLRVSSIGRTFLDMLRKPDLCDGIYNVIQAYMEHAEMYLDLIIDEIDQNGTKIEKIRAGYLLEDDERCNIKNNPRIERWKKYIQRGGSRKLDPNNGYAPKYSKTWCLSINIEE